MKNTYLHFILILMLICCLSACEKAYVEESADKGETTGANGETANLILNITKIGTIPFSKGVYLTRTQPQGSNLPCTRINAAVFKDQERLKTIHQEIEDSEFGKLSFSLPEGTYRVVIIAHSGLGNATISQPEKVTFKDNKVTDTYYYYQELTIGTRQTADIELRHAVAMFRFSIQEDIPEEVAQWQFKYTGGSSTFDATTGLGCVQSRQTELRAARDATSQPSTTFEIFTFPHQPEDHLKIHMTALDAEGYIMRERTFEEVPIHLNQITEYAGCFFTGTDEDLLHSFVVTTQDEWL